MTLRLYDDDKSDNVIVTNPDGSTASIDPRFNPATVVTLGVSGQGVDPLDPPGATEPPVVTTTGTNLFFLQQPTAAAVDAVIAPAVRVRVWDNTGAPLSGVSVEVSLQNPPAGAVLSGATTAVSDASGVATFATLSVNQPAIDLRLRAAAAVPGVVAAGVSAPFDIDTGDVDAVLAAVSIFNYSAIYDGLPKAVMVTTDPSDLAVTVTYNGSETLPAAIGANLVVATVIEPGYTGSASAVQTIASTMSVGGSGGAPYGPLSCGPGVFATGIRPSTNSYYGLLGAQLMCSDSINPARFSGAVPIYHDSYVDTVASCGTEEVMVGVHGETGAPFDFTVIQRIGPLCRMPGSGEVSTYDALGGGQHPSEGFTLSCPAGQAVTGVVGGVGEVVDSIALVCAPEESASPTITSASPSTLAAFQYVTITGTDLPATAMTDVLFSQGDFQYASDYLFFASEDLVVARVPTGVLANGPATIRLKDPDSTVFTNSVPVTISSTPGAPVLLTVYNAGEASTTLTAGQEFLLEADGTGTAGTTVYWFQGDTQFSQAASYTGEGPTGRVGTVSSIPAGVTPGTWMVRVTSYSSPFSNGVTVSVTPAAP